MPREIRVIGADGEALGIIPDIRRPLRWPNSSSSTWSKSHPVRCRRSAGSWITASSSISRARNCRKPRKKQVHVEVKEIKLRPKTDDHDLEFKVKHVRRFLEEGNKAKVTLVFRGREITHMDIGRAVDREICGGLDRYCRDRVPSPRGWAQMFMIVAPKVKK